MITKDQLAESMTRECDICVHLYSKIGAEAFEYRPSPAQRSTFELLQYLSICGIASTQCMAQSDWKLYGDYSERVADMKPEDFPAAMERQKKELEEFFASVSEETLETQEAPFPGGDTMPLGAAILNGPAKWLAAYKLQLFLYAKATGASEIGTANAWIDVDAEG